MARTIPLYNALVKAGVAADDAKAAAESVAHVDQTATKADLAEVRSDIRLLQGEMRLIRWMLGVNLAFSLAILARLLF